MGKSSKKGGVLGRLLGPDKSDSDCCSVQIVEESDEAQEQTAPSSDNAGSSCCAPETERKAPSEESRS
ncbi:hypothetical protein N566_22165 [Streptomycetaceae bacterium MP113-05]|nr:hypothetical protein N566_22165 [Streptomycetaceae bacterium MP113-05]